jgi:hypothetical protein
MNEGKAVNHGGHGDHGEKTRAYAVKVFAVPAVFAVVIQGFSR